MSSDRLERKRRSEFDDSDDSAGNPPPSKIRKSEKSSYIGKIITDKFRNFISWFTPTSVRNYMLGFVKSSSGSPASSTFNMVISDGMVTNSVEEEDEDEVAVIAVQNGAPAAMASNSDKKIKLWPTVPSTFALASSTPVTCPEYTDRQKARVVERQRINGYVNVETINEPPKNEKKNLIPVVTKPVSEVEILLDKNVSEDKDIEIIKEIPAKLNRKPKNSSKSNSVKVEKSKFLINQASTSLRPFTANEVVRLKERDEYSRLISQIMRKGFRVPPQKRCSRLPIEVDLTEDDEMIRTKTCFKKEKIARVTDFVVTTQDLKHSQLKPRIDTNSEPHMRSNSDNQDSDDDVQVISDLPIYTPRKKLSQPVKSFFDKGWIQELKSTIEIDTQRQFQLIAEQTEKLEQLKKKRDAKLALEKQRREELKLEGIIFPEEEEAEEDEVPELTPEMLNIIRAALGPGDPGERFCTIDRVDLNRNDVSTLLGLNWLNDNVINFYLAMIVERSKLDNYPSVYAFSSFFYTSIKSRGGNSGVLRWTKKINIFSYDLIMAPLHLGLHWALIVVDNRTKKIKYYDSMGCSEERSLRYMNDYLIDEMMDKQKKVLDPYAYSMEIATDIPKQMNGSDCGMFTLKYAEYISRDAPFTFNQTHMPYFRQRMVYELLTKQIL